MPAMTKGTVRRHSIASSMMVANESEDSDTTVSCSASCSAAVFSRKACLNFLRTCEFGGERRARERGQTALTTGGARSTTHLGRGGFVHAEIRGGSRRLSARPRCRRARVAQQLLTLREEAHIKYVRGSESNCEQDSRKI